MVTSPRPGILPFVRGNLRARERVRRVFEGYVMPKLKTHRGAAKRFKKTGTGKIRRSRAYHSHILTKKSAGRKRHLGEQTQIAKANEKTVERMLVNL